jgi:ketosteroid isomerase-like protein
MKIRYLLLSLVGLATSFALPVFAQEQNAVDPEVRQQIASVNMKLGEAQNKHDAAAAAALYTLDAVKVLDWGGTFLG